MTRSAIYGENEKIASPVKEVVSSLTAALDAASDGFIILDGERRIACINAEAERILGLSTHEVEGCVFGEIALAEDETGKAVMEEEEFIFRVLEDAKKEHNKQVHESTGPKRHEFSSLQNRHYHWRYVYVVPRTGRRFLAAITVAPVILQREEIPDTKKLFAIVILKNISENVEIEKAKNKFISLASHQMRTPLSIVTLYTAMLISGNSSGKERIKYLRQIDTGNKRLIKLVDMILDVSRLDLGTFMPVYETVHFGDIVADVMKIIKPISQSRGVALKAKIDPMIPASLRADSRFLRIIVQNILENAVLYTPKGGSVSLVAEDEGGVLHINVSDTGYGIPEDQQSKVFTRMFRADNIREKVHDGCGLGLHLVKAAVEKLGGSIRFSSKENQGTEFSVILPLLAEEKGV